MKPRARLTRLVLINWRGIFYQPFDMAAGITALEGANGAGKTTVMVALFVALLPDLRLLSFRNVGEGGGEGDRGIHGRLGASPPAYSLIEFETGDGRRLWGGVQLTRKSEPNLDLTPFLIEGLPADAPLHEVFLHRMEDQETVATLPELKQQVALAGGMLRTQDSVTAYLAALHEQGLLPLPLAGFDERSRFHKVLETSMMGGLSGFIQKGLRDYLLAEDGKLRSHVGRMRENLEACRVTRRQIAEARERYQSIHSVHEAGWGMLSAAFHGTRLRARQAHRALGNEITSLRGQRREVREAEEKLAAAVAQHRRLETALKERQEIARQAGDLCQRAEQAYHIAARLRELSAQEEQLGRRREEADARRRHHQQEYDRAYQAHETAQARRSELAGALADAQTLFEQLHHHVANLRAARRSLADAREALPDRDVQPRNARALLDECEARWREALNAKGVADRALEGLLARRQRFDAAHQALSRIAGTTIAREAAAAAARHWDERFREIEAQVKAAADLPDEIVRATDQAQAQAQARDHARALGVHGEEGLKEAMAEARDRDQSLRAGRAALEEARAEARNTLIRCEERLPRLEERRLAWQEARDLAAGLADHAPEGFVDATQVAQLVDRLQGELHLSRDTCRSLRQQAGQCGDEADRLEFGGGRLPDALIAMADQLDGQLLAERLDDLPEERAARIEARLGPLAAALLVDEPEQAARQAARRDDRPDTLWFLTAGALEDRITGEGLGDSELVREDGLVRLTRHPRHPVIGHAARGREIERLRRQGQQLQRQAEQQEQTALELERALGLATRLAPRAGLLFSPSPLDEIRELEGQQRSSLALIDRLDREIGEHGSRIDALAGRIASLTELLPRASLLDPPDWQARVQELTARRLELEAQARWAEAHQADRQRLREGFVELESPPDEHEAEVLAARAKDAEATLACWQRGRELLGILCDRLPWFDHEADEALLARQDGQLAELRQRHARADGEVRDARTALDRSASARDEAESHWRKIDSAWLQLGTELARRREELAETGLDGSAGERDRRRREADDALRQMEQAAHDERVADKAAERARHDLQTRQDRERERHALFQRSLRETRAKWQNWVRLKGETRSAGLLGRLLEAGSLGEADEGNPITAFNSAHEHAGELRSILAHAEGGGELMGRIEQLLNAREDDTRGLLNLRAWLAVRAWLEQRIPRDIAQAEEPEIALSQIHDHLRLLESRLADQESALRQRTEDVANSIAGRIRRETQKIGQFNRQLAEMRFGSIQGIRLHFERIPTFEALLTKLRSQPDLFASDVPLEEAMVQVFEQVGGGRVRGDQLLDYREYLRLSVRVRRIGSDQWTEARAGSLSTGESIGVGAAILIVILGAWEQQAAILRGARSSASLRFLFLDEATRLDANALDTLTDFCERMKVQLLAAAPGLERARRGHVYTLMRLDRDGQEEVLVRGRKWT